MARITVTEVQRQVDDHEERLSRLENGIKANYDVLDRVMNKVSRLDSVEQKTNDMHDLFLKNGLVGEIKEATAYINIQKDKENQRRRRVWKIVDAFFTWLFRGIGLFIIYMLLRLFELNPKVILEIFKIIK